MKKLSKILALVLALMMMFAIASMFTASAANIPGGTKLYLVPSANWNQSNARFAAYFFGDGEVWVSMTKVAGESNLYEVTVPAGKNFTNVIFCRMNPSASANNWNNKWNQTSDLVYNGTSNCYTVKEGTWDKGGGTWSTYGSTCSHANVGPAATCTTAQLCLDCGDPVVDALGHTYNSSHLCTRCNTQATFTVAGSGAHLGTEWDTGNTANDMTYADGVYTKVYTNVAAGSYALKVARDHDWGTAYPDADKSYTVATAGSTVTVTLKGTTVNVVVEAPHTHEFVEGKCECGEVDPDYVPAHVNTLVVGDTNKIVVSGNTLNDYGLPIEWVAFVAEEDGFYSFVGDNGALAFIFTAEGGLVSATGAANLEAGAYLICLGNGATGEFNVAVTKAAWVNALVEGANKIYVDGSVTNAYGLPVEWVTFEVTEGAHYKFTCAEEGALALIYAEDQTTSLDGWTGEADLVPGKYAICVGGGVTGMFNVTVEKTAIVPEYNWWVSDGSLYTVEGDTIKYNGAGNTYACVGCDVTTLAAGKNTFTITITNNGASAARVRVDLQATVQVGNHKVVNTEAVGGDVWTDAEWGGSIVTVPAGESVTLVITYDETTERGAVKDLIIFADSARGDAEVYATDITVSGMEFSKVSNLTHEGEQKVVLGDNTIVIDGCTTNLTGTAIEWLEFVVEEAGTYVVSSPDLNCYIYDESKNMASLEACLCGFSGVATLEPGTYYICVGNGGVTGEFTVNVKLDNEVEAPYKNTMVVGDNHYIITDNLYAIGYEFITIEIDQPGTYVVTGGAPMKVYMWTILGAMDDRNFVWNVDGMQESGFAPYFVITLQEAGTYYMGFNYEYVTDEREFDISVELHSEHTYDEEGKCTVCGQADPDYVAPEDPKPEAPKAEEKELNFFEKIIAFFVDLFNKFLALFKF